VDHISVVSVPVSDQERARRFYVEQVGLEVVAEGTFGDQMRWLQVGLPGARTTLTLVNWFPEMPAGSLRGLVIDCADLQADYESLSARGVIFSGPPAEQAGGSFCTFEDPDGNRISLRQSGMA
jgi:catechol 2,3-dioxygenase-like lactoylglutathione lyase family enzyme